jgi:hypothetical protein
MKTITAIFILLYSWAIAEEFKIDLQINTDEKISVIGSISSDPPISVEVSTKLIKKEGDINHYDCVVSFSRKLNEGELQRMELSILPDTGFSDPLGFGECFAEVKWKDLREPIWKVNLHTGMVNLPFEAKKDERIYCEINSGSGYYRRTFIPMREDNKCLVHWRASSGTSTIRLIKEENFMNSIQHKVQANWSSWTFDPTKAEDVEFKLIQK